MSHRILLSFLLLLQTILICSQKLDYVTLTVYYDAFDAHNRDFIANAFFPSYNIIASRVILKLIPYAINEQTTSSDKPCLADNQACLANIIHACGINQCSDQGIQLNFANCMAQAESTEPDEVTKCANASNFSSKVVNECIYGPLGSHLHTKNGYIVKSVVPRIYRGPVVTFNNYNGLYEANAWKFLRRVCSMLNNPPPGCH